MRQAAFLGAVFAFVVGAWLGHRQPTDKAAPPVAPTRAAPAPPGPAPAPAPACPEVPAADAALLARWDALRLELLAAQAAAEAREGAARPWPDDLDPAWLPEALERSLAAWEPPEGINPVELDCAEYPCLLLVVQPNPSPPGEAVATGLDLPGRSVVPVRVQPLDDGRPATVFALEAEGAGLDSRDPRLARRAEELAEP